MGPLNPSETRSAPYQLFMLALCLYALLALGAGVFLDLNVNTRKILGYADTAICGVFLLDFLVSLARAPNRLRYLYTWGWIDLVSSIPLVGALRWGRVARVFRLLRLLRGFRSTKILAGFVLNRRAESAFLAVSLMTILIVTFSSIAILQFETAPESNIQTPEDAFWWSLVTVTTVGYGDRFPISTGGRFIAAALMIVGVGLFGTFTGYVAKWFLTPGEEAQDKELESIRKKLEAVHQLLIVRAERPPNPPGGESD